MPNLLSLTKKALSAAEELCAIAKEKLRVKVSDQRQEFLMTLIEKHQTATHGFAWVATYIESLRQMQKWAEKLELEAKFGEVEQLIHQIAFGEYLSQLAGGIPMNQGEIIRLQDIGLDPSDQLPLKTPELVQLMLSGNTQQARVNLVELMQKHSADTVFGISDIRRRVGNYFRIC